MTCTTLEHRRQIIIWIEYAVHSSAVADLEIDDESSRHPAIPPSPRHQREHAPAQVFTRASGVALGFRSQFGSNILRELIVGIVLEPSAHGEPLGRLVSVPAVLV